ncbi:uncharacterized protein LOC144377132 [Ictidomys tridecemlineatus]
MVVETGKRVPLCAGMGQTLCIGVQVGMAPELYVDVRALVSDPSCTRTTPRGQLSLHIRLFREGVSDLCSVGYRPPANGQCSVGARRVRGADALGVLWEKGRRGEGLGGRGAEGGDPSPSGAAGGSPAHSLRGGGRSATAGSAAALTLTLELTPAPPPPPPPRRG